MSDTSLFTIWFVNNSQTSGNVCVYQDASTSLTTAPDNVLTLAWMVYGANPGGQVKFTWTVDYEFAWFNQGAPSSQGFASPALGEQVVLSCNQYGYEFSQPATSQSGECIVATDTSIPAVNTLVAGIAMNRAGTFAVNAQPNITSVFVPAQSANLSYLISFGYAGAVNDVLSLSAMNPPGTIVFPYGVYVMTAAYNLDGTWTVSTGAPTTSTSMATQQSSCSKPDAVPVYRAGWGLVTSP